MIDCWWRIIQRYINILGLKNKKACHEKDWKSIAKFWIRSAIVWKKNLIANSSTIKRYLKTKIKSYGDGTKDFHNREIPKVEFDYTSLAVILNNFVLEKDENY